MFIVEFLAFSSKYFIIKKIFKNSFSIILDIKSQILLNYWLINFKPVWYLMKSKQ